MQEYLSWGERGTRETICRLSLKRARRSLVVPSWAPPAQASRAPPCLARPALWCTHFNALHPALKRAAVFISKTVKLWLFISWHLYGFWIMCLKASVAVWGCVREYLRGGWVLALHRSQLTLKLAHWDRAYVYCVPQQNLAQCCCNVIVFASSLYYLRFFFLKKMKVKEKCQAFL